MRDMCGICHVRHMSCAGCICGRLAYVMCGWHMRVSCACHVRVAYAGRICGWLAHVMCRIVFFWRKCARFRLQDRDVYPLSRHFLYLQEGFFFRTSPFETRTFNFLKWDLAFGRRFLWVVSNRESWCRTDSGWCRTHYGCRAH